jgi:hypothetical protein
MKYFIDTEFIEGFYKPFMGKRRHFIDLISIGIVAEDGRKYYAISNEWNYKDASDWVKENVIHKLPLRLRKREGLSEFNRRCKLGLDYKGEWFDGKSNAQIAGEIFQFVVGQRPEFYGYYADYDWVLFCSLFGKMIDLPQGFPMYCRDLKQMADAWVEKHIAGTSLTFKEGLEQLKAHPDYPKNDKEHNALEDAKWNHQLYQFLQS